ncbi:MAG TPA: EthD family reductase [Longimicrobium sp.]|jgi:uncharacterized protein (TIGR02118 family)
MAQLIALYHTPQDSAAFDTYFAETHIPLAAKIPGLARQESSVGPVMTPEGPSPYHAVGVLTFASMDDLMTALQSPEGQAASADLANFATGGATVLVFEHRQV